MTGRGPRTEDAAVAFDVRTCHLVVHGGSVYGDSDEDTTWLWDRTGWREIEEPGPDRRHQ